MVETNGELQATVGIFLRMRDLFLVKTEMKAGACVGRLGWWQAAIVRVMAEVVVKWRWRAIVVECV